MIVCWLLSIHLYKEELANRQALWTSVKCFVKKEQAKILDSSPNAVVVCSATACIYMNKEAESFIYKSSNDNDQSYASECSKDMTIPL